MKFDIVFVTYNSSRWIDNCFKSILESNYDLKQLSIAITDNNSQDSTVEQLKELREKYYEQFREFVIIESCENLGFGKGNNLGFSKGSSPYVLFLNIDTELDKNALTQLKESIENSSEDAAMWELRQFPYEHPKMYNPITGYTSWSSGAAFVIKRDIFNEVGKFDKNIFMYAEDVDLSWKVRAYGYKIKYVPKAVVNHFCYKEANEVKTNQYLNSITNNIMLRYKFGSFKDVLNGHAMFFNLLTHKGPFEHSRKMLLKHFLKQYVKMIIPFLKWKIINLEKLKEFKPKFIGWDYEIIREGAFHYNSFPQNSPKVSVVVRTCGRPNILRETLISLKSQTYSNIEVVIVEDGKNISEDMIKNEFSNMNIVYKSTGKKVGRCVAGNIGLQTSTGKYVNFLDDDDVFFADHVEALVNSLEENKDYRIAYSLAFETPIKIISKDPYIYQEIYHNLIYRNSFNRMLLFHHNYIPIQAIMFDRDVFVEEGGFDEKLDVLEDWDLWVRYALKNDFLYVRKVTSMYRVPFDRQASAERQTQLDGALDNLRKKHKSYVASIAAASIANELQAILDSYVLRISSEVFAQMKAKQPFVTKLFVKTKTVFKRFIR